MDTHSLPDEPSEFLPFDIETLRGELCRFLHECSRIGDDATNPPSVHFEDALNLIRILRIRLKNGETCRLDIAADQRTCVEQVAAWIEECWKSTFSNDAQEFQSKQARSLSEAVQDNVLNPARDLAIDAFAWPHTIPGTPQFKAQQAKLNSPNKLQQAKDSTPLSATASATKLAKDAVAALLEILLKHDRYSGTQGRDVEVDGRIYKAEVTASAVAQVFESHRRTFVTCLECSLNEAYIAAAERIRTDPNETVNLRLFGCRTANSHHHLLHWLCREILDCFRPDVEPSQSVQWLSEFLREGCEKSGNDIEDEFDFLRTDLPRLLEREAVIVSNTGSDHVPVRHAESPVSALKPFTDADLATLRARLESFREKCQECQATLQERASKTGYGPDRHWREARDVLQRIRRQTGNGNPAAFDIVDDELSSGIRRVSEFVEGLLRDTFSREVSDYGASAIGLLGGAASLAKDEGLHWLPDKITERPPDITGEKQSRIRPRQDDTDREPAANQHFEEADPVNVADNLDGQSQRNLNSPDHTWDDAAIACALAYKREFDSTVDAEKRPRPRSQFVPEWHEKNKTKWKIGYTADTLEKKLQSYRKVWDPDLKYDPRKVRFGKKK